MTYRAITIDTNVVVQAGFQFNGRLLGQFEQFKSGPVSFVIAEVILWEIRRRHEASLRETRDRVAKAMSDTLKDNLLDDETAKSMQACLDALPEPHGVATRKVVEFNKATGAKVAFSSKIDVNALTLLYFQNEPPFEQKKDKRSEFPDAIALLSLEKWASIYKGKILAVSLDAGWAKFAETSDYIDVVKDLATALVLLQGNVTEALPAVVQLLHDISSETSKENIAILNAALSDAVANLQVDVQAHSAFHFEEGDIELEFKSFELKRTAGKYEVKVVRLSPERVVFRVPITIFVEATGNFSLSVWDGEDDEYIPMGGAVSAVEHTEETYAIVTVEGKLDEKPAKLSIVDVEIDQADLTIDFGHLELEQEDSSDYGDLFTQG